MRNSNTTPSANMARNSSGRTIILFCLITLFVNYSALSLSSIHGTAAVGRVELDPDLSKSTHATPHPSDTSLTTAKLGAGLLTIAGYLALWTIGNLIFRSCPKNSDSITLPPRFTTTTLNNSQTLSRDQEERYKDFLNTLEIKYSPMPKRKKFKTSTKSSRPMIGKSYSITPTTT